MNLNNKQMPSIQQIQNERYNQSRKKSKAISGNNDFSKVLQKTIRNEESVKFSKHANLRLTRRNIHLSSGQLERLNDGVQQAKEKGINDSLMLMDNLALVVNVKNNVVVTALEQKETKNHVFTNIDGAVVL